MELVRTFPDYFSVSVIESTDGHIAALCGELDIASGASLQELLIGLGGPTLTLDVSLLGFLDSTGMDSLVRAARVLRDQGHKVVIRGLPSSGPVRQIVQLIGESLFEEDRSDRWRPHRRR